LEAPAGGIEDGVEQRGYDRDHHDFGHAFWRFTRLHRRQHPGLKIVASQTANWERDQAFNVTQNILQSHPDIQAMFACNDVMALGAVEAVAAAGKTKDIAIVGFDAQDDARTALRQGRMAATIAQNPREMGRLAIVSAYKILHRQPVPPEQPVKIELVK